VLSFVAKDRIVILENYLKGADDVATRLYYLANYLLVKGSRTYLDYFAASPLEWYPEWEADLGLPLEDATMVSDLLWQGVYRRQYEKGLVLVNPSDLPVSIAMGDGLELMVPQGGGAIGPDGAQPGTLEWEAATSVDLGPKSAAVLRTVGAK